MNNITISKIIDSSGINILLHVIRESFQTVANDFNITPINAPTNPAFIELFSLQESINRGLIFFGAFLETKLVGCVAIEDSKKDHVFYIERLAVLPSYRHFGYGIKLMDYACSEIINNGGKIVSIGIINENVMLKKWYSAYGFSEVTVKLFDHLPFSVCFMRKEISI